VPGNCVFKTPKELELIGKVEPVLEGMGFQLWDLEVIGSERNPIVRISLEKPAENVALGEANIGIEDCTEAHRELGPLFDVWDPFTGAYTLEVSSPGEHASLRTVRQFEMARGDEVEIVTLEAKPLPPPAKPRKNWKGRLVEVFAGDGSAEEGSVLIEDALGQHALKWKEIRSAQWKRNWA